PAIPPCAGEVTPECAVHTDPINGLGPIRGDDRNLIIEAQELGYTVIRTRAEFDALLAELRADESLAPQVLGLFAADDLFNDEPEETLIAAGLVDDTLSGSKAGRIICGVACQRRRATTRPPWPK
ncbi:MAG: hypothetical protein HC915_18200, partial [Anaerolineae bacterium]|nr:hypothetical protein [Anaerolineae bacterium]